MPAPTNLGDVVIMAVLCLTAAFIVWIVLSTKAKAGVEQIRRAELERDEARRDADRLRTRVDQLEQRLDRRIEEKQFDRTLEG